jgi:type II secretory pathway component PulK
MIRTLRSLFLGCQLREKLLLVAFLTIVVLVWVSNFGKRAGAFWREQRRTTSDLAEQAQWIANSGAIEISAQKAAGRLDAAKTLDGVRLVEAMQKLATDAGLRNTATGALSNPPGNGQFSIHSLDFTVRLLDPDPSKNWESLTKFYRALQQRSPYIGIESFTLRPEVNRAQLSFIARVSSVEITKNR